MGSEAMSESPEQILNRITAEIANLALDAVVEARDASPRDPMEEVFDREAFETQVHRLLRDECKELWEESAAEVECEQLRKQCDHWKKIADGQTDLNIMYQRILAALCHERDIPHQDTHIGRIVAEYQKMKGDL